MQPIKIKPSLRPIRVHEVAGRNAEVVAAIRRVLPDLARMATCPVDHCATQDAWTMDKERTGIWFMVIHLNDQHDWSLHQIADWLDTLPYDLTPRKEVT